MQTRELSADERRQLDSALDHDYRLLRDAANAPSIALAHRFYEMAIAHWDKFCRDWRIVPTLAGYRVKLSD